MKILMKAELQVLAKCEPTHSKDGQNTYYKLTVFQGQEAGQVSCPFEVYSSLKEGDKAVFNMEYNSEYKSLRLVGISHSADAVLPAPAAPDGSGASDTDKDRGAAKSK